MLADPARREQLQHQGLRVTSPLGDIARPVQAVAADELYRGVQEVDWSRFLAPEGSLVVAAHSNESALEHTLFVEQRVKDAICDQLREQLGERPSVDTQRPDLPVVLHVGPERAALYVDTSGEALFKRGWREDKGEAPLKETLAAAMLAAAGWKGREAAEAELEASIARFKANA